MKIATYNLNGINGRLAVLTRWLEEARPDVVCLQELKAPDDRFVIVDALIASVGFLPGLHQQAEACQQSRKKLRWAQRTSFFDESCFVGWHGKVAS